MAMAVGLVLGSQATYVNEEKKEDVTNFHCQSFGVRVVVLASPVA